MFCHLTHGRCQLEMAMYDSTMCQAWFKQLSLTAVFSGLIQLQPAIILHETHHLSVSKACPTKLVISLS